MILPSGSEQSRARLTQDNAIPQLPEGWDVQRFRFLFRESKERNGETPVGEMLSVSEYRGVVPKEYEHEEQRRTDEELQTYRIVRPGQLAVNTMWLNHLGLGVSNHLGHVSPAYSVYDISPELDKRFAHHLFRSQYYLKIYLRYLYGIRPNSFQIKTDDWNSIPVIVPPLGIQKAIADFLDRETARIDQLIEKKQRFVELLGERRQRIIDQLSTKGLQNDIEEKVDTGIDWLGEVPRHWTVEKLAWHFTAEKGRDAQKYTKEYCGEFTGPYPVYSGQTANEGVMGTIDSFDYYFGEQGVLFSTTVGAKAMTVSHLTGKFSLSQNCMIIIPVSKALPIRFYYYQLQPLFRKERSLIPEHMQASFRVEDLHRYWIAMPPRAEAEEIAGAIDAKLATLEPVRQKTQHSIKSLREFRSALITAAVTGQIDVATWGRRGQTDRRLDQIEEAMQA